ncbi:exonuclease 1-like [Folsomia candida]|uniref:exonuclease 1-like n=1 Tax=Folsomia candida TaxID=158441 RepID=UPI001604EC51|nr:exonuclease 1-like [Folsomia candida]
MLLFGCSKVLFSMNSKGWGNYYKTSDIPTALGWEEYHHEKFVKMMILAKCDYVKNIPGIGIAKAQKIIEATLDLSTKSILATVVKLFPESVIPAEYAKDFDEAYLTYLYSAVVNPIKMESTRINTPPPTLSDDYLRFAGRFHNKVDTTDIVLGNIYLNKGTPSPHVTLASNLDKPLSSNLLLPFRIRGEETSNGIPC